MQIKLRAELTLAVDLTEELADQIKGMFDRKSEPSPRASGIAAESYRAAMQGALSADDFLNEYVRGVFQRMLRDELPHAKGRGGFFFSTPDECSFTVPKALVEFADERDPFTPPDVAPQVLHVNRSN